MEFEGGQNVYKFVEGKQKKGKIQSWWCLKHKLNTKLVKWLVTSMDVPKFPHPPTIIYIFKNSYHQWDTYVISSIGSFTHNVWNWYVLNTNFKNMKIWTVFCSILHPPIIKAFATIQTKSQVKIGPTFSIHRFFFSKNLCLIRKNKKRYSKKYTHFIS